jgi:hypothetical protein
MRLSTSGSSYARINDPLAAGAPIPPAGVGQTGVYADRLYDNGYVKMDPGTGNPATLDPNTTWNWGFDNPAQYDSEAQQLSFQKSFAMPDSAAAEAKDVLGAGLQALVGARIAEVKDCTIDLCFGFQGIWGAEEDLKYSDYGLLRDRYSTAAIGSSFPASGFQGTYLGPFDTPPVIPSPVLGNLPGTRAVDYNQVALEVSPSVYQFSFGPKVTFLEDRGVKLHVRPTVSANLIHVEARRSETIPQSANGGGSVSYVTRTDEASDLKVLVGLGAVGGADIDLGNGFFVGLFGGYEWIPERVELAVGPSTVKADASGWVAGITLGLRF